MKIPPLECLFFLRGMEKLGFSDPKAVVEMFFFCQFKNRSLDWFRLNIKKAKMTKKGSSSVSDRAYYCSIMRSLLSYHSFHEAHSIVYILISKRRSFIRESSGTNGIKNFLAKNIA